MLIFLGLLAAGIVTAIVLRARARARREPQPDGTDTERDASQPVRFRPPPPEHRVDFSELKVGDAVAIETVSGSRYRFTLLDSDQKVFDVVCKGSNRLAEGFQAVVAGSRRNSVTFEGTFAVGCQLFMYVMRGDDLIPLTTSLVEKASLRAVGAGDNEDLLN